MAEKISRKNRASRQAEYEKAYDDWFESLSLEDRERLARQGLDQPDNDISQINGKRRSIEDLSFLSTDDPLPGEEVDEVPVDNMADLRRDILAAVFSRVRSSGNPLLYMDALLSALRVNEIEGLTCEELARRHRVTKQRFAYIRNRIIDSFGLPPAVGGRSVYRRDRQKMIRGKRPDPKEPWVVYTPPLDAWRRWWNEKTRSFPVEEWTEDHRCILRNELKWFAKRWVELGGDVDDLTEGDE